jgi:hypothetical protein
LLYHPIAPIERIYPIAQIYLSNDSADLQSVPAKIGLFTLIARIYLSNDSADLQSVQAKIGLFSLKI